MSYSVRFDCMIGGIGVYYLIRMEQPTHPCLAKSTGVIDSVAKTTRIPDAELGLGIVVLPRWFDVGDADAIRRLLRETDSPPVTDELHRYIHPTGVVRHGPADERKRRAVEFVASAFESI